VIKLEFHAICITSENMCHSVNLRQVSLQRFDRRMTTAAVVPVK
jgi:hypothetical protein